MTDKEHDLFDKFETAIVRAVADLHVPEDDGDDLIVLISVFAKLAASAAVFYGINENDFTSTMRKTYKTVYEYKKGKANER